MFDPRFQISVNIGDPLVDRYNISKRQLFDHHLHSVFSVYRFHCQDLKLWNQHCPACWKRCWLCGFVLFLYPWQHTCFYKSFSTNVKCLLFTVVFLERKTRSAPTFFRLKRCAACSCAKIYHSWCHKGQPGSVTQCDSLDRTEPLPCMCARTKTCIHTILCNITQYHTLQYKAYKHFFPFKIIHIFPLV